MLARADLHMHSYYSLDGEFSIKDLLALCQEQNLTTVSLTDHNSVRGVGKPLTWLFPRESL